MDISETLAPKSDQLDAIELVNGPRVFTIERVSKGTPDQPVNIHLVDFPRPWRPGKSMRRVLAAAWGVDASKYAGRQVELYFDPEVTFGKDKCGGTRIKALSHIDGTARVPLLVARGKSATYAVEPLDDRPAPTLDDLDALFERKGVADEQRLPGVSHIIGRNIDNLADLAPAELATIVGYLEAKADA